MEQTFSRLDVLIQALANSGLQEPDKSMLKEVKSICRSSDDFVKRAHALIVKQLHRKHSQVRLSALQISVELFQRSKVFRELILYNLQEFFELTAGTNSKNPLPPPKSAAKKLKGLLISTFQKWKQDFGHIYTQIELGYSFLKNCHDVDFETLTMQSQAEQAAKEEQERRIRRLNEEKMKSILAEMKENEAELQDTQTTLATCLELLLPTPESFFIPGNDELTDLHNNQMSSDSEEESEEVNLRHHGITPKYSLQLQLNPKEKFSIRKTEENSSIIVNAKDAVKLLTHRFLPKLNRWLQLCAKHSNSDCSEIKKLLDWKESIVKQVDKYKALNIEEVDTSESENEFEEVTKEGYEETIPEYLPVVYGQGKMQKKSDTPGPSKKDLVRQPAVSSSDVSVPSTSGLDRKSKLLKVAPKLPYDVDLYHWEDEHLTPPTLLSVKLDNPRFWGTGNVDDMDEIIDPGGVASLRTRVIEYSGQFVPVKWSCRAPLSNGKLCPRKDRVKCPFHGKIVARDELGVCANPEDDSVKSIMKPVEESHQDKVPDWQDPNLLAELKAATGVDLKMPIKRGEGKKKGLNPKKAKSSKKFKVKADVAREMESRNFPGLTTIKGNDPHFRISKKLFNRSALKRVANDVNQLERKRYKDKFGDQFNYF